MESHELDLPITRSLLDGLHLVRGQLQDELDAGVTLGALPQVTFNHIQRVTDLVEVSTMQLEARLRQLEGLLGFNDLTTPDVQIIGKTNETPDD